MHRHQYARSRFETTTHAMRQGTTLPFIMLFSRHDFYRLDISFQLCYNAIGFTGKRPRIGLSIPSGLFFYARKPERRCFYMCLILKERRWKEYKWREN